MIYIWSRNDLNVYHILLEITILWGNSWITIFQYDKWYRKLKFFGSILCLNTRCRSRDCFKVFILSFREVEPQIGVLGNQLVFPKGESDVWHESRQALAEHEEAGRARWNRGGIKRANYGFADLGRRRMRRERKKKKIRESKRLEWRK